MEQQYIYTIRADMGDHYQDVRTGKIWANSKFDARCYIEQLYPYAEIIIIERA